jgi:hypothetical protein
MTLHTKADFARIAGVSRPAISRGLRSGLLVETKNGRIDGAHPLALAYLERHRSSSPSTGKNGTGRPVEGGAGAPIMDADTGDEHGDEDRADTAEHAPAPRSAPPPRSLAEQKLALEIKLKRERLKRDRLLNLKEARAVVDVEQVDRMVAVLAATLEENFRTFGDRHADGIEAMCAAGAGRIQIAVLLDDEIDTAMCRVQEVVWRELDEMRPLDERIADTPELRWLARLLCPTCGGKISKVERATLSNGRDRSARDRSGSHDDAPVVPTDERGS